MGSPVEDLAAAVRSRRVVVVGGGVAGLVAALECAKVGLSVTVLEEAALPGGTVRPIELDGMPLDAAVEGWRRSDAMTALVTELGLADRVVPAADSEVWIAGLPGNAPLPRGTIAGIPQNPWDDGVRRLIGWRGAWRAYLDRLRPPLTIGDERRLGRLVRTRMGARVLERMVAPLSIGAYGLHPDDVEVQAVAPGLSAALTRTGSLGGGIADLLVDRPAGSGVEGLLGGTAALVPALVDRLVALGAEVVTGAPVTGVRHDGERWQVKIGAGEVTDASAPGAPATPEAPATSGVFDAPATPEAPEAPATSGAPRVLSADGLVVAVPEGPARALLAGVVPAWDAPFAPRPPVEVVTLLLEPGPAPAPPPAHAVYPMPGTRAASALTDATARWPWLAAATGGRRVVRVHFGVDGTPPATAGLDDQAAVALAVAEATALAPGLRGRVVAGCRCAFATSRPASALGHAAAVTAARGALRRVPDVVAVGGWVAGSGLAQVVEDAVTQTEVLRRALVFGDRRR